MKAAFRISLFVVVALALGCKQSEGDRCQIDDDCESGLVCSESEHVCRGQTSGTIDAGVDAAPVDAQSDAEPADASVDAIAEMDASSADVAVADVTTAD